MGIILKSAQEIAGMRQAGRIVAEVLEIVGKGVLPGITTLELDDIADNEVKKRGAVASFKGYRGLDL